MTASDNNARFQSLVKSAEAPVDDFLGDNQLSPADYEEAQRLIEDGLDYTRVDGNVFCQLMSNVQHPKQVDSLLRRMIAQGGNPLLGERKELRSLLENSRSGSLIEKTLIGLEKEGLGLLNEEGGNLYHTLASHYPWGLSGRMEQILIHIENGAGIDRFSLENRAQLPGGDPIDLPWQAKWLNQVDRNGNTPLHLLWAPEFRELELQNPDLDDIREIQEYLLRFNEDSINVSLFMALLGADPVAANHQGVTPWDLMRQRNMGGLQEDQREILQMIQAIAENALLERGTAAAGRKSSPPRL